MGWLATWDIPADRVVSGTAPAARIRAVRVRRRRWMPARNAGGAMAVVVFVLGVVVGMAVLVFAFENTEPITLRYLFTWQTQPIPLFLVIMAAVGVGVVVAGLFGLAAYLRGRRIIREHRRTIAALQAELHT